MGNKKNKSSGYLITALVMGMAITKLSCGGGYERICVAISDTEVQCVATNKVEKYLSGLGMQGIQLPSQQGGNSLLICDKGKTHPINLEEGGDVYQVDAMPFPCAPPVAPVKGKTVKRYGPKSETGGRFCNGRTEPNSCKDCCLALAVAQGSATAAAGHAYRGTKPGPKGIAADVAIEAVLYAVIYWQSYKCGSNCEVSYEAKERKLK